MNLGIYLGYGFLMAAGVIGYWRCRGRPSPIPPKYLLAVGLAAGVGLITALVEGNVSGTREVVSELERQELGQRKVSLEVYAEGMLEEEAYDVTVEEQLLTETEKQELLEKAKAELLESLGEGVDENQVVTGDLAIPETLEKGHVTVSLAFWPNKLIDTEGVVHWENMEEDTALVEANALLECQELEEQYQFYLELKRENLGARDQFLGALQEKLSAENQQQDSDSFQLPTEILGTSVEWYFPQEQLHWRLFLLGIICILVSAIRQRGRREKEKKRWQQGLERDYPDIVSRLSLLVGAGMTVSAAMGKLAQEYAGSQGERGAVTRPGYEELVRTWNEIQDGIGERRAYENFGIRCGQAKYRKLASLLIQNVRKGAKGIQQLLDGEAQEAYMQQRMYVRQRGEEASTKLLLPMGIMLVLVLAILMVPAMMSMNV